MYNEFDVVRLKELSIDATHVKVGDIELISDSFLDFLSSLKLNDELNEEKS